MPPKVLRPTSTKIAVTVVFLVTVNSLLFFCSPEIASWVGLNRGGQEKILPCGAVSQIVSLVMTPLDKVLGNWSWSIFLLLGYLIGGFLEVKTSFRVSHKLIIGVILITIMAFVVLHVYLRYIVGL